MGKQTKLTMNLIWSKQRKFGPATQLRHCMKLFLLNYYTQDSKVPLKTVKINFEDASIGNSKQIRLIFRTTLLSGNKIIQPDALPDLDKNFFVYFTWAVKFLPNQTDNKALKARLALPRCRNRDQERHEVQVPSRKWQLEKPFDQEPVRLPRFIHADPEESLIKTVFWVEWTISFMIRYQMVGGSQGVIVKEPSTYLQIKSFET